MALTTATIIDRSRPNRSPTKDHGTTASASPSVAAETVRAARSALVPRSAAICGSTPCGE